MIFEQMKFLFDGFGGVGAATGLRRLFGTGERFILQVERMWSDGQGVGLYGWMLARDRQTRPVELWAGAVKASVLCWHDRPEVEAKHPQLHRVGEKCGFSGYIPDRAATLAALRIKVGDVFKRVRIKYAAEQLPATSVNAPEGGALFSRFTELANRERFRLLEIGSRVVCVGSASRRALFPNARRYVGFDYYPDANTDVVGDAHELSSRFPTGTQFDGIFSISVLEHLAMPWVVAMEINRLLPVGGHTFHATHFAWPLHETPWDFWRFTHEGLKAIFSRPLGFEVVEAGLFDPLRLHPERVRDETVNLPLERAFGGAAVLARKIADIDGERFCWNARLDEVIGTESKYPAPRELGSNGS